MFGEFVQRLFGKVVVREVFEEVVWDARLMFGVGWCISNLVSEDDELDDLQNQLPWNSAFGLELLIRIHEKIPENSLSVVDFFLKKH